MSIGYLCCRFLVNGLKDVTGDFCSGYFVIWKLVWISNACIATSRVRVHIYLSHIFSSIRDRIHCGIGSSIFNASGNISIIDVLSNVGWFASQLVGGQSRNEYKRSSGLKSFELSMTWCNMIFCLPLKWLWVMQKLRLPLTENVYRRPWISPRSRVIGFLLSSISIFHQWRIATMVNTNNPVYNYYYIALYCSLERPGSGSRLEQHESLSQNVVLDLEWTTQIPHGIPPLVDQRISVMTNSIRVNR